MQEAMPILIMLGVIIVALTLMLVGLFLNARSRDASEGAEALPNLPVDAAEATDTPKPPSESVHFHLEPDGAFVIEVGGRRFTRLDDIGDERWVQRVLAAVGQAQSLAGITPAVSRLTLSDELRAGHAPADGALVVEFRGQPYRRLTDIQDGETGRQLLAMIGELVAFARGAALPEPAAPPSEPEAFSEEAFLERLAAPPAEPAPIKMPTLVESLRRRPSSKPELLPIGIAGQVEAILQEHLVSNASLEGRSIHVVTTPDGSLAVEVERRVLRWPEEVTDPAVREAVQKAIRIWERS